MLDATTGQNGLIQAKQFKEAAGITGIVLTKLDGTAKMGARVWMTCSPFDPPRIYGGVVMIYLVILALVIAYGRVVRCGPHAGAAAQSNREMKGGTQDLRNRPHLRHNHRRAGPGLLHLYGGQTGVRKLKKPRRKSSHVPYGWKSVRRLRPVTV